MTVIVQDDHLAAGAWAACGLLNTLTLCLLNENRCFFFRAAKCCHYTQRIFASCLPTFSLMESR